MITVLIFLHTAICILIAVVILMQSGRGGGLTEGFAPAESLFGAKTNEMMIKTTTILATIFLLTCSSLAYLSSQRDKSLMEGVVSETEKTIDKVPLDESKADANVDVTKEVNENTIPENPQVAPAVSQDTGGEQPASP